MNSPRYCLDSGVFIESWHRYYAQDVFPTLWCRLAEGLENGTLVSSDVVLEELRRKDDEILMWCNTYVESFLEATESIQLRQKQIIAEFPNMVSQGSGIGSSRADPWVIATGAEIGCCIVSFERLPASSKKPKIPYVCQELQIRHKTLLEVMQAEGWSF